MIEDIEIEGRPARIAYLVMAPDGGFTDVDPDEATLAKVMYADGDVEFLKADPATAAQFDVDFEEKHPRGEKGRWESGGPGGGGAGKGAWGKAVGDWVHRESYDAIKAAQLGKGSREFQREGRGALAKLEEAIKHAPVFAGTAYRGLTFGGGEYRGRDWAHTPAGQEPKLLPPNPPDKAYRNLENLHEGSTINLKCFQSFTASEGVARLATEGGGWSRSAHHEDMLLARLPKNIGEPVKYSAILAITTDKARDVSYHAGQFRWQKEVLLGPTARIRVTKVEKDAQGRLWIHGRHL